MNNPTKSERITIKMGGIPLDVFRLTDGQYRLSQAQTLETIGVAKSWFSSSAKSGSKPRKFLESKGFSGSATALSIPNNNGSGAAIAKGLTIDDAVKVWSYFARNGNDLATDLLEACAAESIERRADAVFGVIRSEEDRQAKMQARIEGKETRRHLMDAIREYLERHPELSENRKKFMFINVSQQVDKQVFGRIAAKLAQDLGVSKDALRDALTPYELLLLREVEDSAMRRIDLCDTDPVEAVRQAAQALLIPVQIRKTN